MLAICCLLLFLCPILVFRNRTVDNDGNASPFAAGPLPRGSVAPPGAEYSGLLECPVTTRLRKDIAADYDALGAGHGCDALMASRAPAVTKPAAPPTAGFEVRAGTRCDGPNVDIPGAPYGGKNLTSLTECEAVCSKAPQCSAFILRDSDGICAFWKGEPLVAHASSGFTCYVKPGALPPALPPPPPMNGTIATAAECFQAAAKELALFGNGLDVTNASISRADRPPGCTVLSDRESGNAVTVMFNHAARATGTCGGGETFRAGQTKSLVTLAIALDLDKSLATITLTGPAGVWFGVGLGAIVVDQAPWALIVDGYGNVSERKLRKESPGDLLAPSVHVVSNTAQGVNRTVVLTRPMPGKSAEYYSFAAGREIAVPFINAIGFGPQLAHHKLQDVSSIAINKITK